MIHLAIRGHDLSGEYTPKQLAQAVGAKKIKNVQFALNASFPDLSAPEKMNPGMGTFFKNEFQEQGVQIALLSCYSNLIHPQSLPHWDIVKRIFQMRFLKT